MQNHCLCDIRCLLLLRVPICASWFVYVKGLVEQYLPIYLWQGDMFWKNAVWGKEEAHWIAEETQSEVKASQPVKFRTQMCGQANAGPHQLRIPFIYYSLVYGNCAGSAGCWLLSVQLQYASCWSCVLLVAEKHQGVILCHFDISVLHQSVVLWVTVYLPRNCDNCY